MRILIVEDALELRQSLVRSIRRLNDDYQVICAPDYSEAIHAINTKEVDLVICDYYLPHSQSGLQVWDHCKKRGSIPFLLISGMSVAEYLNRAALIKNPPRFLHKPFSSAEFQEAVESTLYE